MTNGTRRGEGSGSRPGRSLAPGKTRYPLYRRLGGPQGRSGQVRKISPPPGFDPQTVQPVACRYTDYATRPTSFIRPLCKTNSRYTRNVMTYQHVLNSSCKGLMIFFSLWLCDPTRVMASSFVRFLDHTTTHHSR